MFMKLQMKKVVAGLLCCTCSITTVLSDFTIANAMQKATGLSSDHQLAMKQMSKKVVSAMEVVSDYVEKESLDEQVILSTKPLQSVKTAGDFIMSGSTLVKYQGNAAAVVIPENVTEIGYEAFKDCITLQEISFPSRLRSIDYGAFMGCVNLKKVDLPDCLRYLGSNADSGVFEGCTSLHEVHLPIELNTLGANTFKGCTSLTTIQVPKDIETVGVSNFEGSGLRNVIFADNIKKIPAWLFNDCNTLTSIEIPETVIEIGYETFRDCKNLTDITFSNKLRTIEAGAFRGCSNLKKITLPNSLVELGSNADSGVFEDCISLEDITLSDNLKVLGAKTFYGCTALTDIVIPKTLEEAHPYIFTNSDVQTVTLEEGMPKVPGFLFCGFATLESIVLPESITEIELSAFTDCINLQTITLPKNLNAIGENAFHNCNSLEKVVLPDNINEISYFSFDDVELWAMPNTITEASLLREGIPHHVYDVPIPVDSIQLNTTDKTMISGTTYDLFATIAPSNATNKELIWTSSNTAVVTVSASGRVTARGNGTAIITATAKDGSKKAARCTITVKTPVSAVKLNVTSKAMKPKDVYYLSATVSPSTASNTDLLWISNNTKVATVSASGRVTARGNGTAIITATAKDGSKKAAKCTITVKTPVSAVKLNVTSKAMKPKDVYYLSATVSPSTASNTDLLWISNNTKVATVSASGRVTARGNGTAIITATAKDGSKKAAKCTITVKTPVSSLKLNVRSKTLNRGNTYTLKASIYPSTASNKSITWSSSNTKVAKVDSKGKVTAVNGGSAIITAKASNGMVYKCNVYVRYKITYYLNGGKNDSKNPSVYYNQNITLKNPTRKGYSFVGWYSDSACRKKYPKVTTKSKGDIKRYAKWAKISVGKASTPSLTNLKGKKMQVKLRKVAQASGYQITYTTDKRFKSNVKSTYTSALTKTLTALKTKKTYYVKVRAYKYDSTKAKVYGSYSSVKAIRIKK